MSHYRIRILDTAADELAKLDEPVARRIVIRIRWLAEHLDSIRPIALTGDLAGLYKLQVGDCRILYEVLSVERVLVIHLIGRRRQIYQKR